MKRKDFNTEEESNRYVHRRNTLLKKNKFDISTKEILQIKERDKVCVYCKSKVKLELDHTIYINVIYLKGLNIFVHQLVKVLK